VIREAEAGEGALIAEEFWYPLATEMASHSPLDELTDDALAHAREAFDRLLEEDDRYDLLSERDRVAVAYASVEIDERPTRRLGRHATVVDLYVKPGHRGEGHGTRLLDEAETIAQREACDYLRISAEWGNEGARRLYERVGYEAKQVSYTKRL
jgi:ribosomal protein S18 acetylase RimI-like enzyme